jgi:methyltransferase (TIGR00027 family)
MQDNPIRNVSDTALWIAGYRALETERPDAVFKDPLAKKLAGERGMQIVAAAPHTKAMAFAMMTRTSAIDRLVLLAIDLGVDAVINIGAGLDTRPYRLPLPKDFRWFELDLEEMIRYKEELLRDDIPKCNLTRVAVDLTKDDQRISTFRKLGDETNNALIITEGLIGYLTNEQAGKLATDLASITSFEYWIMDYNQGKWRKNRGGRDVVKFLQDKAPIQFSSDNPIAFFEERGWKVKENIFILDEADRLGRKMPMFFFWHLLLKIKKVRETGNRTYGYVMYEKASSDF